jgi:hypothetical protein
MTLLDMKGRDNMYSTFFFLILVVVLRLPLFGTECLGLIQLSGETPVISPIIIYGLAIIMNAPVFSVRYNLYLYI